MSRRILSICSVLALLLLSLFTSQLPAQAARLAAGTTPTATPVQQYTFSGVVTNAVTGAPVVGAVVHVFQCHSSQSAQATTAANGSYALSLPASFFCDSSFMQVIATGYVTQNPWSFSTSSPSSVVVNVALQPVGAPTTTATPTPACTTLTVTGRVTDTVTGQGISGATVEADTSVAHPFAATSAADGSYLLSVPGASDYGCEVIGIRSWATGYQELDLTLNSAQLRALPTLNLGLVSTTGRTSTPTATASISPTPTTCIPPTPEALRVSPVTSPVSASSQVITVTLNHSSSVTVTDEAGSFTSTSPVSNVFSLTVNLVANSTNHLRVQGTVTWSPNCPPYSLSTMVDTSGNPLNIVQSGGITSTPTGTPTRTPTPTLVTPTPTGSAVCSPVTTTIAAPFTHDGAGTFCWQTSNLGSYINSWNLASLTVNGVNFTNAYAASGAYPAKINGFWYVSYTGSFAWSHFETK